MVISTGGQYRFEVGAKAALQLQVAANLANLDLAIGIEQVRPVAVGNIVLILQAANEIDPQSCYFIIVLGFGIPAPGVILEV